MAGGLEARPAIADGVLRRLVALVIARMTGQADCLAQASLITAIVSAIAACIPPTIANAPSFDSSVHRTSGAIVRSARKAIYRRMMYLSIFVEQRMGVAADRAPTRNSYVVVLLDKAFDTSNCIVKYSRPAQHWHQIHCALHSVHVGKIIFYSPFFV